MQKPLVRQKLEPKLIFATERTFVHWLHASVVFLTFGAGAMAVADGAAGTAAERSRAWVVALVLSAGSIAINVFALSNYKWRLGRISCSVWNAALSEALRRLGYYARRVNSPLSVPRAP